jgi:thymidine phosphorylase
MARMAWGGADGRAPTHRLPIRGDDVLAGEHSVGNVKNNELNLIEPIVTGLTDTGITRASSRGLTRLH